VLGGVDYTARLGKFVPQAVWFNKWYFVKKIGHLSLFDKNDNDNFFKESWSNKQCDFIIYLTNCEGKLLKLIGKSFT
jgi:hypothetical protein